MKEFMFYICNAQDAKKNLSPEEHLAFIQKCETYIGKLKATNKLIAAQPLFREGIVLRKTATGWEQKDIAEDKEVQVGYYHILANDLEEALVIAKENPEFEYVPSAIIEIRPVKTKEQKTGFVYPVN